MTKEEQIGIVMDLWAEGASESDITARLKEDHNIQKPSVKLIREGIVQAEREAMQLCDKEDGYWKGVQIARVQAVFRKAMVRGESSAATAALKLLAALTGTIDSDRDKQITISVLQLANIAAAQERALMERVAVTPVRDGVGSFSEAKDRELADLTVAPAIAPLPDKATSPTPGPFGGMTNFRK